MGACGPPLGITAEFHRLPFPVPSAANSPQLSATSGLAVEYFSGDVHHRNRAVLTRALQDAIRFLLREPGAPHEDAFRALDRLAILELTPHIGHFFAGRAKLPHAMRCECDTRFEDAHWAGARQHRDGHRAGVVPIERERLLATQKDDGDSGMVRR